MGHTAAGAASGEVRTAAGAALGVARTAAGVSWVEVRTSAVAWAVPSAATATGMTLFHCVYFTNESSEIYT